jgi:hypothetical protein
VAGGGREIVVEVIVECVSYLFVAMAGLWPVWWWLARRERKAAEAYWQEGQRAFQKATELEMHVTRAYKELGARMCDESYEDDPR